MAAAPITTVAVKTRTNKANLPALDLMFPVLIFPPPARIECV